MPFLFFAHSAGSRFSRPKGPQFTDKALLTRTLIYSQLQHPGLIVVMTMMFTLIHRTRYLQYCDLNTESSIWRRQNGNPNMMLSARIGYPDLKSIFRGLNLILSITEFKLLHLSAISPRSLFAQTIKQQWLFFVIHQFHIAQKAQTFLE